MREVAAGADHVGDERRAARGGARVEARDPHRGADPQRAGAVEHEGADVVARQAVAHGDQRGGAGGGPTDEAVLGGEPERAVAVLDEVVDAGGREVGVAGEIDAAVAGSCWVAGLDEDLVEAGAGAGPDAVVAVLEERVDARRLFARRGERDEQAFPAARVEAVDAGRGGQQVGAVVDLEQVAHRAAGQAVLRAIAHEARAVEAAELAVVTEPEETARVRNDAEDPVAGQAVGGGERGEREALGVRRSRQRDERACEARAPQPAPFPGGTACARRTWTAAIPHRRLASGETCDPMTG